jgi:hypothetical protein
LNVKSSVNMKEVTNQEFERIVDESARSEHNKYLRLGQFIPQSFLREQARKKLSYQYRIIKSK